MNSESLQAFSIYWREHGRTSIAHTSTFEATRETAKQELHAVGKAIKAKYPDAVFLYATKADSSRFPVKDWSGNLVAPSRFSS